MEPLNELLDDTILDETTSGARVTRQAGDPQGWDVRLPGEKESHVVNRIRLVNSDVEAYCTCQTEENRQENLQCPHACAVEAVLQHRKEAAAARRHRGLTYVGERTPRQWQVWVREGNQEHPHTQKNPQEYPLDPRPSQKLRNHSPDGFSWGYQGSGPAQLALAILLGYTGDEELALAHYQEFKRRIIAALPSTGRWEIHPERIDMFLAEVSPGSGVGPLPEVTPAETQRPQLEVALEPAHEDAGDNDGQFHDEIFPFSGYFGRPAQCRLRWIRRRILGQEKLIVIATELPTNTGTSVTNRIEHLAGAICRRYQSDPERLILIEHYPAKQLLSNRHADQQSRGSKLHDPVLEERFALVSCHREGEEFTHPQWTHLTKQQVETLLGQPLLQPSELLSA